MITDFRGPALDLDPEDVTIIAGYLGVETAMVRAVMQIESRNEGFEQGRPIILCEPHVFYRELPASKRQRAVNAGLAHPQWRGIPYPRSQDDRYEWLRKAMEIDVKAALKACSWGLGQLMGFNYAVCGFDSVEDFVKAMMHSQGAQLMGVARFIVGNRLQRHLRNKDWAAFARGYNGRGYRKNGYHTKLERAYKQRPDWEKAVPPIPSERRMAALLGAANAHPLHADPQPEEVIDDVAASDRVSTEEVGAVVGGATTTIATGSQIADAIEQGQDLTERLIAIGPWVLILGVGIGVAYWLWMRRRSKRNAARAAKSALQRREG